MYITAVSSARHSPRLTFVLLHQRDLDFAVPFLFFTGMGCTFVLAMLSRRKMPDHVIYFVVSAGFCLLPPVFLLLGWAKVLWPSVICAACGIIALSGVALFAQKDTLSELKKRLHL